MTTAVALIALTSTTSTHHRHHYRHYQHHHECVTAKCAHNADVLWARHHPPPKPRWVIPEYIVKCESDFTNEPAKYPGGPAGYYQIEGPTWHDYHGPLPDDAAEHSKAEQDAVAERIWDGGRGASQWECA